MPLCRIDKNVDDAHGVVTDQRVEGGGWIQKLMVNIPEHQNPWLATDTGMDPSTTEHKSDVRYEVVSHGG